MEKDGGLGQCWWTLGWGCVAYVYWQTRLYQSHSMRIFEVIQNRMFIWFLTTGWNQNVIQTEDLRGFRHYETWVFNQKILQEITSLNAEIMEHWSDLELSQKWGLAKVSQATKQASTEMQERKARTAIFRFFPHNKNTESNINAKKTRQDEFFLQRIVGKWDLPKWELHHRDFQLASAEQWLRNPCWIF